MRSRWRLLATPGLDGAMNMAVDIALMVRARATHESVFRVYGWSTPTLSLGRNQRAVGMYDPAVLEEREIAVVRRPTGGRAILHWREVTYSVTAPAHGAPSLAETYAGINGVLLEALSHLGVSATVADRAERQRAPDTVPCFAEPSPGEIVLRGGGKLVGSAQFRENGALLQHGSILLEDDQSLLAGLAVPADAVRAMPATLASALGCPVQPDAVRVALFDAARALLDPAARALDADAVVQQGAKHAPLFRDPLWTWRR